MNKMYYEIESNFQPLYKTALAIIEQRTGDELINILNGAQISVVNTDYDNWNGGTYGYTVYINLSVKKYSSIEKEKISEYEKEISEALNEVIKGDDNNSFYVQICPWFHKSDIDWSIIGDREAKSKLLNNIETIKNIMVSVSTNGARIQDEDNRYKRINLEIKRALAVLKIEYKNQFDGLWDWYGKWKADFKTYQERREYINGLFNVTLSYFDESDDVKDFIDCIVDLNDWDRINRTIIKIKRDSKIAINEEDYQTIGLLCREVIISLAQTVYSTELHGITDDEGVKIGKTDAIRMLSNYISYTLSGSQNEELRIYAKSTNKLANSLTHKRTATKRDMSLCTSATIALINFIGILEGKN